MATDYEVTIDNETGVGILIEATSTPDKQIREDAFNRYNDLLKASGLTSYSVSKATGIASSSLSEWKTGRSMPKAEKLMAISEYLGTTIDYLVSGKTTDARGDAALPADIRVLGEMMKDNHDLYSTVIAIKNLSPRQLEIIRMVALEMK